jgi:hypothetical protein
MVKGDTMEHEVEEPNDFEGALLCSRVFAVALSYLLEDNQGVVVEIEQDPDLDVQQGEKFLVYKSHGDVAMISCDDKQFEGIGAGDTVWINTSKLN